LIITANLGVDAKSEMNAGMLAAALNANAVFALNFQADAMQYSDNGTVAGSVLFNKDISKPSATTTGGYKIESALTGTGIAKTSSGIGMTGQSDANERLVIESEELGSKSNVSINVVSGFFATVDEYGFESRYASGSDMEATINGLRAVTDGANISIDKPDLSVSMNVANFTGRTGFTITGGGALFQLGPDVVSQQQIRVGIASMLTTKLGGADGQLYMLKKGNIASLESSDNGRKLADRIVTQAIENVASLRGRLGAIQRGTLEPTISALQDSMVALTEANAMITNADFAVESSNLTRLQLLIQAGAQTLGIANQLPQYAASLVR
jgi:flagellin